MPNLTSGIADKLIVHFVYLVIIAIYRLARTSVERRHPVWKPLIFVVIGILFVILNIRTFITMPDLFIPIFVFSFLMLCYITMSELLVLWNLGILGADRSISKGIGIKKALSLCNDSLDFLGIGASKLVATREDFRKAVARCHRPDRPIRFLLCRPDDQDLLEVARRAGRPLNEYQSTVRASLAELRSLKMEKALNIEVKFYSKIPLFRLMFINDTLCLASHYILGEGDGSQLPQLHIAKRPLGNRDIESFYYPLRQYFENMWRDGETWDFERYS